MIHKAFGSVLQVFTDGSCRQFCSTLLFKDVKNETSHSIFKIEQVRALRAFSASTAQGPEQQVFALTTQAILKHFA